MFATFHGNTCVRIQEKTQSRDLTLIIDPYNEESISPPGIGAGDIVLLTRGENNIKTISGNPFIINAPGEYEIKEVMIKGIKHESSILYRFDIDNIRFLHTGLFKGTATDSLIEECGDIDVLFVPIGAEDTLKAHQAVNLFQALEPRVIIPMAYKIKGIDKRHEELEPFLKEIGKKDAVHAEKYKVSKKSLPEEDSEVFILDCPK